MAAAAEDGQAEDGKGREPEPAGTGGRAS
jgi:hypothetical protein